MTGLKFILAIVSPRPAPSVARFRDGSSRNAEKSRWRNATFETIRITFLKIATRIQPLRTRICVAFPSGTPNAPVIVQMLTSIVACATLSVRVSSRRPNPLLPSPNAQKCQPSDLSNTEPKRLPSFQTQPVMNNP